MKESLLDVMCCPKCQKDLSIRVDVRERDRVKSGELKCGKCGGAWPIRDFIPRFVSGSHYADSFGKQWKTFARTQLDTSSRNESELRFTSEMGWTTAEMKGVSVVEFGSGAGRFVDVVSRAGAALVVGVDITDAVDAAYENLGNRENVAFIQADVFQAPLKKNSFDRAYSIGVLHHTPTPELGFKKMVELVRVDGSVGLSLYEIILHSRNNRTDLKSATGDLLWALNMWRCAMFRVVTTRMPSGWFLWYCKNVVWLLHHLNKVPVLGLLRYSLPSTCYRRFPFEWSMVDTFDTYATQIVHQYRHKDLFQWFLAEGLDRIIVHNSRPGWVSLTGIKRSEEVRQALRLVEPAPVQL